MEIIHFLIAFLKQPDIVLKEFITTYGTWVYAFLFMVIFMETGIVVMPLLPGDSLLFAIGMIATSSGAISLYYIIPLLILAALIGDNVNYFIGRRFGNYVQSKERILFLKKSHIEETERYFEKNGPKTIILARFIPIVRTVAPFVAGAGEMKYSTFLLYSMIGAVSWVAGITLLGSFLGDMDIVKNNFTKVVLIIILLSISPMIWKYMQSKIKK